MLPKQIAFWEKKFALKNEPNEIPRSLGLERKRFYGWHCKTKRYGG